MNLPASDKPLDTLREESIDQLVMNYGHGKLSLEAFERRIDQVLAADEHQAIIDVCADLEMKTDDDYIAAKKRHLGDSVFAIEGEPVENIHCILSTTSRTGSWRVPRQLNISGLMGTCTLDFGEAIFSSNKVTINLFDICGTTVVHPRGDMRVKSTAKCFLTDVSLDVSQRTTAEEIELIITGTSILGSIEVKEKKTIKQHLVDFGNSLRGLFSPPKP